MHVLLKFGAFIVAAAALGWVSWSFGWDTGYWRGTRTAQWDCYHNRKTCEWAKDEPPLTQSNK